MILALQLYHFSAAVTFAFFASIVLGITLRNTQREMIRYGLQCFAWFVLGMFLAGWLMWLLHH
ncbi:MAG TPA: hypothetical protein VG488_12615 [Candidatus Angelobacter sp.]|jgi:hypothetical protein|nr:hypothetical protein [Candidatus Angelobacter sp.]